ncbi:MAG TPA: NAD(P)/FAD-dependent oxidoreductase [Kofleriaceae bacterium]|jgi:flavin-dependent dehydrogenase|nr:NAD(P)/FAD-dependent oxidoreductase [Kofleriaceae bacterium]
MSEPYDVLVIGGGPAGSTCARVLGAGGARVAVIDRAEFPRVKLCAGWLSPAIWDVLELTPAAYPRGLWEWHTCHVHYRGKDHAVPCHGWFIRRYEFDDFLLHRTGASLYLGTSVKQIERDADGLWSIGGLRAKYLVGAGGTHCPVARMRAPVRPRRAVGAQELELQTDAAAVARTRLGKDGEPELLLFEDVGGYGWNIPKSDWINVGCGTLAATAARSAWHTTHDHLRAAGHIPPGAEPQLDHLKGHSYFLFDPLHLDAAYGENTFLVGDSLGLAHPITAEGILPATVSGRHAAEAILAGDPASYPARLRKDPILADYRRVHAALGWVRALRDRIDRSGNGAGTPRASTAMPSAPSPDPAGTEPRDPTSSPSSGPGHRPGRAPSSGLGATLGKATIARGFAWMFSGARLPAPRLLDLMLGDGERP